MRITKNRKLALCALATAAVVGITMTGCSAQGSTGDSASGDTSTIEYWGWVPGMDKVVDTWNAKHPELQVKYSGQASGNDETLAKISAAVKAGTAPCLSQIDGKWVTSLVSQGAFEDVTKQAAQYKKNYLSGLWSSVNLNDVTYGLPQDSGPMVMYYNKAKLDADGIAAPKTWDEFAAAAKAVHAAHPDEYLAGFSSDDAETLQSLVQQAGGQWWSIDGDSWKVDVTGSASEKVANYWQGLIADKVLSPTKRWDPAFYNEVANGKILAVVGAAWQAPLLAQNAADVSGQWNVAPMPQWKAGESVSANNGGSTTMVLKGCKNPESTLKFANWLNTNTDAMLKLGLFPAAKTDSLTTPADLKTFFGGADVYKYLTAAAGDIKTGWTFAPTYASFSSKIGDGIASTVNGTTTLPDVLTDIQKRSMSSMKDSDISAVAAK